MGDALRPRALRRALRRVPALLVALALPTVAQADRSGPAEPVAPLTAEERAKLEEQRAPLEANPADPAWDAIIDEPLYLRLSDQRPPDPRTLFRPVLQLGLGGAGGIAALYLGLPLAFSPKPEALWLYGGLYVSAVSLPIYLVGGCMIDDAGHWGWTLAGTTAGVLIGTALAVVATEPIIDFVTASWTELSLVWLFSMVVFETALVLPTFLGAIGFELGLRVARRRPRTA